MTKEKYETYHIIWQGIPITIRHNPNCANAYKNIQGYCMTHTEIIRDDGKQLPITHTGYTSRFMDERQFEDFENIQDYVVKWLVHAGQSKEWKAYVLDQNQLKLFDFE